MPSVDLPDEKRTAHMTAAGRKRFEKQATDKQTAHTTNMSREAALAFANADANGDGVLEWHEVCNRMECKPAAQLPFCGPAPLS